MAKKKNPSVKKTEATQVAPVKSYRYPSKRKNNPPAGLAAQGKIRETPKLKFAYDPHLPPVLRFDATGASDKLPELLQAARTRAVSAEEAQKLAHALRQNEPWLEWASKREKKEFEHEDEQDRAKHQTARRWIAAVNNWGQLENGILMFAGMRTCWGRNWHGCAKSHDEKS